MKLFDISRIFTKDICVITRKQIGWPRFCDLHTPCRSLPMLLFFSMKRVACGTYSLSLFHLIVICVPFNNVSTFVDMFARVENFFPQMFGVLSITLCVLVSIGVCFHARKIMKILK